MIPEIYNEERTKGGKKPVQLALRYDDDGFPELYVNGGDSGVPLLTFYGARITSECGARSCLEEADYDTNFAAWDESGAVKLFYDSSD